MGIEQETGTRVALLTHCGMDQNITLVFIIPSVTPVENCIINTGTQY